MKKTALMLALSLTALGTQAAVLPAQSKLSFTFKQMGVPVEGGFSRFTTTLKYDPKAPQEGEVNVAVDLSSVNGGGDEASAELKKAPWFDVKRFATATFTAKGFTPTGKNTYLAKGELTLKGKKLAVNIPFTATQTTGGQFWLDGKTEIKRLSYGIGSGEWEDTGTVADEVQIRFKLLYKP